MSAPPTQIDVYKRQLNDNAIMKICQDLFYLISQGVAAFYPYIWILLKNHGHITTYTDKKLRTINHYAVVFSFDGYNACLLYTSVDGSVLFQWYYHS